jgi:hypothetical protein
LATKYADGCLIETTADGREIHADTVRCVHCQRHFKWSPRRRQTMGWCHGCGGFVCSKTECHVCVNWEQKLDNAERGRPKLWKPLRISMR